MDKYEEAVRIVNNYIRGLKECYENACDIVGDKSKTPAVRAKHARNAEEFYTLYNEVNCILQDIISLDEFVEAAGEKEVNAIKSNSYEQPESIALKNEIKQQLMDSLETLTDKERKVILLYYYEELTLKEISRILEVSESRVSQLHTKALQKMKVKLGDYMEILNL